MKVIFGRKIPGITDFYQNRNNLYRKTTIGTTMVHIVYLWIEIVCNEKNSLKVHPVAVADPGFPVGGRGPRRGGVDSRGSYVS